MMSHGGTWLEWVTKNICWLVIGEMPGKTKVEKAADYRIHLITYESLLKVTKGSLTADKMDNKGEPKISSYSEGYGPPLVQHGPPPAKVSFSSLKPKKRAEIKVPETPKEKPPAAKLKGARGTLDLSRLKSKELPHTTVVHITLRVPSGKVTDLVMELLFMGLDSLRTEDKSVVYAHLKNFAN
jgi:hypothetical protein